MKKTAAKDRKRLRLAAVLALSMVLLLPGVGEASRTLPPAFGANLKAPAITTAQLLNFSRPDAPAARRFALIDAENYLSFAALSVVGSADTACFSAPSHFRLFDLPSPIDRLSSLDLDQKTAYRRFFEPTERIYRQTLTLSGISHQGVYFLQPDPLGPVDSPNLYQGFGFDALNVTDPWGKHEFRDVNIGNKVYTVAAPTSEELAAGDLTIHWSYAQGDQRVQVDVDQREALTWALMAKEFPGSPWGGSWAEFYGRPTSAIPGSALDLYWKSLKANAVPIALSVLGEALAAGDAAGAAESGARSGAPRINLLNEKIARNSNAAALTRSGLPAGGISTSTANTAIVPYDPEFAARNALGSGSRASYYVTPDGQAIPATGYRAIGGRAVDSAQAGNIMSGHGPTYFTFDNVTGMSTSAVKDVLQLKYAPSHVATFDTLQIIDDIQIPAGRWNTWRTDSFIIPEPITRTLPEFGGGGATQAITTTPIKNFSLWELSK